MEEHFNDNYMESRRYPKATFKGLIEKFDLKTYPLMQNILYQRKNNEHGKSKISASLQKIKSIHRTRINIRFHLNSDNYDSKFLMS
jgi:hypothetical protein